MNRLRTRFSLVLCSVLLVATLLPVLIFYFLSKSGLVEATYITNARNPEEQGTLVPAILAAKNLNLPNPSQLLLKEDDGKLLLPWLTSIDPQTGERRTPFILDPATGRILGVESGFLERIVLRSRTFRFRIDLPAWIVIGSFPLFGLLLGIGLSLGLSRYITRPVSQLAEAAQAIGKRDLAYRVETKGSQELQDLARSFNLMAEDLEHAETARRNLMADVAHELRTPLAVLEGNLRAMLDGVHASNEEEIALLYEQTHHLNRLVDDLRELSLAEANQLSFDCGEVNLVGLIGETVDHFDLLARERGIQLKTEIDEPLIHPCLDENRIRQVLHNLLSNAFRYTPKGGKVTISGKRSPDNTAMEITVIDTGIGIPPEELPQIFNRFFRTKESAGRKCGGTGLGLAIVKALVEGQGGQVQVKSAGLNQGSTFAFVLPLSALQI